MRNISDLIEQYLKSILQNSPGQTIEIQRNELADQFQCVPSQINYVISTRFSVEKGYLVESKRGGGGYIRIQKIQLPKEELNQHIFRMIGDELDQAGAEGLIQHLEEANHITRKEANLLRSVMSRDVLTLQLPLRDQIRAKILKAMLIVLMSK